MDIPSLIKDLRQKVSLALPDIGRYIASYADGVKGLKRLAIDFWMLAPWALLFFVCYWLSFGLDNLYRWADGLMWLAPSEYTLHMFQLRLYQLGSTTMRAVYAVIAAVLMTFSLRLIAQSVQVEINNGWAFTGALLAALLAWLLAVAETFDIAVYVLCKVVNDRYTIEAMSALVDAGERTSACNRWKGWPMEWGPFTVTSLIMLWILRRAYQVWRNRPQKT